MPLERRKYKDGDIVGDYGNKLLYRTYATRQIKNGKVNFSAVFAAKNLKQ